jgi:anti-anti-sigma factor
VTQIAIRGAVEDEDKEAFRKVLFHSSKVKAGDIALDLGAVTFLSESALAVLIQLLKAQHAQGASLRLVHLSPWVRKKLERTAILQFFAVDN